MGSFKRGKEALGVTVIVVTHRVPKNFGIRTRQLSISDGVFMRFLKQLFSFTLIILALLISFVIYSIVGKLQDAYLKKIANEYAMFIVSATPISPNNLEKVAGIKIVKVTNVSKTQIIDTYRSKISPNSLRLLEEKLPYFYEIYLEKFPTSNEIIKIKNEFFKSPNIKKVEAFSQNHDQITSLLSFSNNITQWLFYLILFLSILILINQIKIWFFEHNERLFIMHLHGASLLYSSFSVIKTAFLLQFWQVRLLLRFYGELNKMQLFYLIKTLQMSHKLKLII